MIFRTCFYYNKAILDHNKLNYGLSGNKSVGAFFKREIDLLLCTILHLNFFASYALICKVNNKMHRSMNVKSNYKWGIKYENAMKFILYLLYHYERALVKYFLVNITLEIRHFLHDILENSCPTLFLQTLCFKKG